MKTTNKKQKQKIVLCICLLIALLLSVAFIVYTSMINKKTMGYAISVYGVDISKLPVEQAADKILKTFENKEVVFWEEEKEVYATTLKDLGYSLNEDSLKSALLDIKAERPKKWGLFEERDDFKIEYEVQVEEEKREEVLSGGHFHNADRTEGKDAYIQYDNESDQFILIESIRGNQIDGKKFSEYVQRALAEKFKENLLDKKIELEIQEEIYQDVVSEKDSELIRRLEELNQELEKYKTFSISYLFGETVETVDYTTIKDWIVADQDGVRIVQEAIGEFVSQLSSKYNTIYVPRQFQTSYGEQITISGNEYGFRIDKEAESNQIMEELKTGTSVEREPVYSKSGLRRNGKDDLAGSYIEVSLERQHLWLYKDGVLVTETDIISGRPEKDKETYRGAWPIAYKASPYTLSSDFYGYQVNVTYWMPFVYGQGLHDASWQDTYGGDVYKTKGSHGCINLPKSQAELIYNSIEGGYPILIY